MAKKTVVPNQEIDWILRDYRTIDGLDHLGIEMVSVHLFQAMLPGLTNVTQRARYYAFYPWVLHRFAQEGPKQRTKKTWRTWMRSLDFSYAAACVAHEREIKSTAGSAVVGAEKAALIVAGATGKKIDLRQACAVEENGSVPETGAYFKNPEGGFGQYYKAPLSELGVIKKHSLAAQPEVLLSKWAGLPIANAVDEDSAFNELQQIALDGGASLSDLARVGRQIHPDSIGNGSNEEVALRGLLMADNDSLCEGQHPEHRKWRGKSFALFLQYVADCEGLDLNLQPANEFRWACLAKALPNDERWQCQTPLADAQDAWAAYQRNDLLNYCMEALFYASMLTLNTKSYTPLELAGILSEAAIDPIPASKGGPRFPALPPSVMKWTDACRRPDDDAASDPWGERSTWELSERLRAAVSEDDVTLIPPLAARILGRLVTDTGAFQHHPFELIPNGIRMSESQEVHLQNWWKRTNSRASEKTGSFLMELILEWVIFRHLRVATRKLAGQGVSTYKYRPEEGRLLLIAEKLPPPVFTAPRVSQAFRILEDLHYLRRVNGALQLTEAGRSILDAGHA